MATLTDAGIYACVALVFAGINTMHHARCTMFHCILCVTKRPSTSGTMGVTVKPGSYSESEVGAV